MGIEKFFIVLDQPSVAFSVGKLVSGKVVIEVRGETKTKGLQVTFTGGADVRWTEFQNTAGAAHRSHVGSQSTTVTFRNSEKFFEMMSYVLSDGKTDVFLPSGESWYPFSFQIGGHSTPSSFTGIHGKVEYKLEATLVGPWWKFNDRADVIVPVVGIVDINTYPGVLHPVELVKSKSFCCLCCASGPLTMNVRLQKTGFVPGEVLQVEVDINNLSSRTVNSVAAKLNQSVAYIALSKTKRLGEIVSEIQSGKCVGPGDSDVWRGELVVPQVPPTNLGGCRIINVDYQLEVEAKVSGLAINLSLSIPIVIGTVMQQQLQQAPPNMWQTEYGYKTFN